MGTIQSWVIGKALLWIRNLFSVSDEGTKSLSFLNDLEKGRRKEAVSVASTKLFRVIKTRSKQQGT